MFKKLLPILFLFTGFQASAVLIGNLTYDGTYISGDGRTYVGFDTIASWDYATTLAATQVGGPYEGFRIANTADADFFIGSLFGANADSCSTVDGIPSYSNIHCGTISGWTDGLFGNNSISSFDMLWFLADESLLEVGFNRIFDNGNVYQFEAFANLSSTDSFPDMSWLLVKDTVASVPEPSIIALMSLGIFGIRFARRRRQS
jgi:hypothetical protein